MLCMQGVILEICIMQFIASELLSRLLAREQVRDSSPGAEPAHCSCCLSILLITSTKSPIELMECSFNICSGWCPASMFCSCHRMRLLCSRLSSL